MLSTVNILRRLLRKAFLVTKRVRVIDNSGRDDMGYGVNRPQVPTKIDEKLSVRQSLAPLKIRFFSTLLINNDLATQKLRRFAGFIQKLAENHPVVERHLRSPAIYEFRFRSRA